MDSESEAEAKPLVLCETCGEKEFKYKCPACLKLNCSVGCVKKHKQDANCDGKRKQPQCFEQKLKMGQMSIGVLRKDIHFIEKGITLANMVKKDTATTRLDESQQSKQAKKLRAFLKKHRKIHFVSMPGFYAKHKANTTSIDQSNVRWTVDLSFI